MGKMSRFLRPSRLFSIALIIMAIGLLFSNPSWGQAITFDIGEGGTVTGRIVQMVALLTVLSLAPSFLVMITSFTRIVVVLSLLRTALGVQQTPPNSVLISLALFMTFFIMQPTLEEAWNNGITPLINEEVDEMVAFERTSAPFREFMLANVRENDLRLFLDLAGIDLVENPAETPLRSLVPAFMISELKRAFEIGFLLFIPFLVIDLVVASVLMSLGMMMLPPVMIALPFKLIFFVLIDGWYMVVGSLIKGFTAA